MRNIHSLRLTLHSIKNVFLISILFLDICDQAIIKLSPLQSADPLSVRCHAKKGISIHHVGQEFDLIRRVSRSFGAVLLLLLLLPVAQADVMMLAMGQFPDTQQTMPASGATVRTCKVTSVHDGDSMRVRCPGFQKTLPIRLDQIDAPELDQAYGIASRDHLRSICPVGKDVIVHDLGPDKYKRRLGRVFCNGVDANAAMIESGSAWVYDYYVTERSLYSLQNSAKAEKRGLWASPKPPVKPWDFRKQNRKK